MSRGHPFLIYRAGDGGQLLLELSGALNRIAIGRRPSCELALTWDDEVSRVHAELVRMGSEWVVHDDGLSHNGTFVNNERLHGRRRLRGGDVVAVGRTVIAFCVPSHTSPTATRTSLHAAAIEISPAQLRILQALCRPLGEQRYAAPASNRDIADELFLSVETVKGTLGRLFELFGLESLPQNQKRAALAAEAVERGIVRRGDD